MCRGADADPDEQQHADADGADCDEDVREVERSVDEADADEVGDAAGPDVRVDHVARRAADPEADGHRERAEGNQQDGGRHRDDRQIPEDRERGRVQDVVPRLDRRGDELARLVDNERGNRDEEREANAVPHRVPSACCQTGGTPKRAYRTSATTVAQVTST